MIREATLVCPRCHESSFHIMPTDACAFYLECPACHKMLRPLPGDCCVFCSYADVPCPPKQAVA